MPKPVNLVGKHIGNLTVVERTASSKHGESRWVCKCTCGGSIVLSYRQIKNGRIDNCGCIPKPHHNKTHGCSNTALYNHWKMMIYRCEKPSNRAYKYYGQRGIKVCEEWHDFLTFKKWADATKPDGDYTIDRLDNNKGYSPDNCRWANSKEQSNNRRSNREFEYHGETHNLMEWSEILDFDYKRVHNRIYKLGWTFKRAVETPPDIKKRNKVERKQNG